MIGGDGMEEQVTQMSALIDHVNLTTAIVAVALSFLVLVITNQFTAHRVQMGYFMYAVGVNMGGLGFQIADVNSSTDVGDACFIYSRIMYSLVAPLFTLYFMETEKEEGEHWDKRFWTSLQFLVSILVAILSIFGRNEFLVELASLMQYVVVLFMLLLSPKSIRASIGFIVGILFPIVASIAGMLNSRIDILGFSEAMLLLLVLLLYQLDTERDVLRSQAELSEKRVALLMEQIHPHFIYNSLQQIAILSDENAKAVKPAIQNFSGYLRKKFQALTGESMIPFSEEMEHVDMYIELAQILPSRHFEVEKDLTETDFMLPPLTLQPLVENAIQYGVGMSEEGEKIRIVTRREKGYIVIEVQDDGHGKKTRLQTQKSYKSVGTDNVRARLRLLCQGELEINKSTEGTVARIKIPEKNK